MKDKECKACGTMNHYAAEGYPAGWTEIKDSETP